MLQYAGMRHYSAAFPGEPDQQGPAQFFELPERYVADDLKLTDPSIQGDVKALERGEFLLAQGEFQDVDPAGAEARFTEDEVFGYTRENNGHGIRFGQLLLSTESDREKVVHVAIKPFDLAKEAIHEFAATSYLNQTSGCNPRPLAFTPLGFYREWDGKTSLITEYDERVISYDNLFWDDEREPTGPEVRKALARCAFALGKLHHRGLTHGDAQVKNLAVDNQGIRFIDLESVRPFPGRNGQIDPIATRYAIEVELSTFLASLNTGIDGEPRDYSAAIGEIFGPNYHRTVALPQSRVPKEAQVPSKDIVSLLEYDAVFDVPLTPND